MMPRDPRRWGQCPSPWPSPHETYQRLQLPDLCQDHFGKTDRSCFFRTFPREQPGPNDTYFGKYPPLAKGCIGHRVLQRPDGLVRTAMRLRFAHAGIPGEHSALLTDPHVF